MQLLFRREPEALKCQEDEQVQLELRSKALLQKALEQEVASQQRLQVRIHTHTNEHVLLEYLQNESIIESLCKGIYMCVNSWFHLLQEWIGWENNCGQLGRLLDELEAFISSREPEGEDDEECIVQQRLHACQVNRHRAHRPISHTFRTTVRGLVESTP